MSYERLLAATGFSFDDVAAQSLPVRSPELSRIDQSVERHEARRDGLLQQIERRQAGWSACIQRASEDIIDAEFKESPAPPARETTPDEAAEG
jgi:hypothetical protein